MSEAGPSMLSKKERLNKRIAELEKRLGQVNALQAAHQNTIKSTQEAQMISRQLLEESATRLEEGAPGVWSQFTNQVGGSSSSSEEEEGATRVKEKLKGKQKEKQKERHQRENESAAGEGKGGREEGEDDSLVRIDLETFLRSPDLSILLEFLYAHEHDDLLLFWFACEDYKQNAKSNDERAAMAKNVINVYLQSPRKRVPVSESVRKTIGKRVPEIPADLFVEGQNEIFKILKDVWYPKFLGSDLWKQELLRSLHPEIEFDPEELQQILFEQKAEKEFIDSLDQVGEGEQAKTSLKSKKSSKMKRSSSKRSVKSKSETKEAKEPKEPTPPANVPSDEDEAPANDPLKFVNLHRKNSSKKKSLSRRSSQSSKSSKSSKGSKHKRDEESDSEIFPPPGVALKRWVSQPSKFDREQKKWVPQAPQPTTTLLKNLNMTTFNVTKDSFGANHRIPAIISALRSTDSDFIVLQEVTFEFLKHLRGCPWIQDKYYISDVTGRFFGKEGFGQVILSTIPFQSVKIMQLRSKTGNLAVAATFSVNTRIMGLASVQLDHGEGENPVRRDQLMLIMALLKKLESQDMILAGDFGTNDAFTEIVDVDFAKNFSDLWICTFPPIFPQGDPGASKPEPKMGNNKYISIAPNPVLAPRPAPKDASGAISRLGFTVDTKENSLLRKLHPNIASGRYDRLLIFSENLFWDRLMGIKMLGKVLVEGSKDMFPSTHFGISAKVESSSLEGPVDESTCVVS